MDWKQYNEQPETDLFDAIEHRLARRRAWRVGGSVAAVAAVAAVAVGLILGNGQQGDNQPVVASAEAPAIEATAAAVVEDVAAPVVAQQAKAAEAVTGSERENSTAVVEAPVAEAAPLADVSAKAEPQPAAEPAGVGESATAAVATEVAMDEPVVVTETAEVQHVDATGVAPKVGQNPADSLHAYSIIKAPNIIAPLSDVDENRYFTITPTAKISDFRIQIYNRRGQRIFSSEDQSFRWDGTHDGAAVQQGGFVWVATFRDAEGKAHMERGTVVVVH